ncbi:DUF1287 domain-containing protein [Ohtaekwangia sp.]|uniref:DUF1287 domain-containing protein n=1 Tax=Ohtaekwangia sp. TaxID=2066019 RepID=UPI002F93FC01
MHTNVRYTVFRFTVIIALLWLCYYDSHAQKTFSEQLCQAAVALTQQPVVYDPSYFSIPYPNGDVPADRGVCTDVVIRAYRKLGIDLQKEIHEDMKKNFAVYPHKWGLKSTDTNIDHRRVPNLMTFFSRYGSALNISARAEDYKAGDIVCWDLGGGITHIGIVINQQSTDKQRYLIVHNIGRGQEISDCLFQYKIIGHYRYTR